MTPELLISVAKNVDELRKHCRGRPCKPEAEKRQPVTINLLPAEFDAACAFAKLRRESVAVVLRDLVVHGLAISISKLPKSLRATLHIS